ncbi:MAG: hypothetical protein LKG40_01515 [Lachnospiraceae bacterium]|jgi:deoxycytidine triphosphate deaminase|nr:hypothetical protein [Lachnospiraceae bacterium]MCI1328028.1 hypothetical protein [Lachnospiraceae bacterium]
MLYVDKNIKERNEEIFVEGYSPELVGPVSHDLTIRSFVVDGKETDSYCLQPEEMIMVNTEQCIKMPENLLGRIGEKNSRIRQGLQVCGPHYFPGHTTRIILRIYNESPYEIQLNKGDAIGQIFFEELKETPETAYDKQENASFNDEISYSGLGKYKTAYEARMKRLQNTREDLENKENRIYTNIITLMGIFVSVFSLIMVNFTNVGSMTGSALVRTNVSLGFVILLFLGGILLFINRKEVKSKILPALYICMLIALLLVMIFI